MSPHHPLSAKLLLFLHRRLSGQAVQVQMLGESQVEKGPVWHAQSAPHRARQLPSGKTGKEKGKCVLDSRLLPPGGNPCFWFGWAPHLVRATPVVCMPLSWLLNVPGRFISGCPSMTVHLTLLNGKLFCICWAQRELWVLPHAIYLPYHILNFYVISHYALLVLIKKKKGGHT